VLVSFASEPGSKGQPNEDFVAAAPDMIVLLDGAGTPDGLDSGCVHGVPWFTRQLGTMLLRTYKGPTLAGCLAYSIDQVADGHKDVCDLAHPGTPSATVIMVRIKDGILDYLVLADSVLLLRLADDQIRVLTDDREAITGQSLRREMDALPAGTAEHRVAHREYVRAMRAYRNRDHGFWVADAQPTAAAHALTGSVNLADLRDLALLSDGASRLADRFGLLSHRAVMDLLRDRGPSELIAQTRAAEASDPSGNHWPRGKATDDATAVYCSAI
jgi:Protein phosphatase 2C